MRDVDAASLSNSAAIGYADERPPYDERTLHLCIGIADYFARDRGYDDDVRAMAVMIRNKIMMHLVSTRSVAKEPNSSEGVKP